MDKREISFIPSKHRTNRLVRFTEVGSNSTLTVRTVRHALCNGNFRNSVKELIALCESLSHTNVSAEKLEDGMGRQWENLVPNVHVETDSPIIPNLD
jgi:hypothetical protein